MLLVAEFPLQCEKIHFAGRMFKYDVSRGTFD